MQCLVMGRHDPSRRERCDLRRHAWSTIGDNSLLSPTDHIRRGGDGLLEGTFQAFHAWLPSSGPSGTNASASLC
jgi:hypothetical protein